MNRHKLSREFFHGVKDAIAVGSITALCVLNIACMANKDNVHDLEEVSTAQTNAVEAIETLTLDIAPTPDPIEEAESLEITVEESEPEIPANITVTGEDRDKIATMLAKTIWGESRGIESVTEQACIVWTVLNRFDAGWGDNIEKVLTKPHQFYYRSHFPTVDDYGRDLKALAEDILIRWEREHNGEDNIGRVLAPEYVFYHGKNGHNWFRDRFIGNGVYWNYSLESPYEN